MDFGVILLAAVIIAAVVFICWTALSVSALARRLNELIRQLAAEHEAGQKHIEDGLDRISRLEARIDRIQEHVQLRLNDLALDIRNQTFDTRALVCAQSKSLQADSDRRLGEMAKTLDSRDAVGQIQEAQREFSRQVADALHKTDALAAVLAGTSAAVAELSQRLSSAAAAVADTSERVSGLSASIAEMPTQVSALLGPLSKQVVETQARVGRLSDQVSGQAGEMMRLAALLTNTFAAVTALSERLSGALAAVEDTSERVSGLTASVAAVPMRVSALIEPLSRQAENAQARADRLSAVVEGQAGAMSALSARWMETSEAVAGLSERVAGTCAAVTDTSERVTALSSLMADLPLEVSALIGPLSKQAVDAQARAERLSAAVGDQADEISALVARWTETSAAVAELSARLSGAAVAVKDTAERVTGLSASVADFPSRMSAMVGPLSVRIAELSGKVRRLADLAEAEPGRSLESLPIDKGLLQNKTEREIIALAEAVSVLRPLVPYPKWRFDADWINPDMAYQLRQHLWRYCNDRRLQMPVVIGWHYGARLCLYLGNDLSRQIYIAGCIDPNEFAFLDRYLESGMTFLDAGANEGIYSVFAAKRVGNTGAVWAFEPSRRELDRLQRNIDLNSLGVRVFPLALADWSGQADLTVAGYEHEGHNTLGAFAYAGIETAGRESVEVARLDDIVERNPPARLDVVKVDVEGCELRLLRGAEATLQRYRPVLLVEVSEISLQHQGSGREKLLEFLRAHQYDLYVFDDHSGLPAPAVPEADCDNILAVPAEKCLPEAVYRLWPAPSAPCSA